MARVPRPSRRTAAGVAAAGTGAAGVAAGVTYSRRRGWRHPDGAHAFGHTPDRTLTAVSSEGTVLHIEVDEPKGAGRPGRPTIVLCHGFCLDLSAWVFQRRALVAAGYRVVTWDQRNHGLSQTGPLEHCTIDQLGRDLRAVLDVAAPEGPLVLAGHSMGGMTIMSLAGHYPDYLQERLRGAVLMSTSAGGGGLVQLGLGKLLDLAVVRLGPGVLANLSRRRDVWTGLRRVGSRVEMAAVQRYGFGAEVPKDLLRRVSDVIFGTSLDTIGAFLPQLDELDVRESLRGLVGTPVLVINGTKDELTPPEHSVALVEALPDAEHVVVPGAGHLLPLERPDLVDEAVLALVERGATDDAEDIAEVTTTRAKRSSRTKGGAA